jgi:hypothetical protein
MPLWRPAHRIYSRNIRSACKQPPELRQRWVFLPPFRRRSNGRAAPGAIRRPSGLRTGHVDLPAQGPTDGLRKIRQRLRNIPVLASRARRKSWETARDWRGVDGTPSASRVCIVIALRTRLSALALIASVVVATTGPLFAFAATHPVCVTKQHDCGKTARIVPCCCSDRPDASRQGGLVESNVQLARGLSIAPATGDTLAVLRMTRCPMRVDTSPLLGGRLDLPTLFASLLI